MTNYASVEAMTRMITSITKTIQAEQAVVESLRKDYQAVGLEWNDSQYEKLGPVIDDAVREPGKAQRMHNQAAAAQDEA